MNIYDALSAAVSAALDEWPEHNRVDEHEAATGAVVDAIRRVVDAHTAELRAENERLRAGLYPLGQHTIEWAEGLATDIGASPDSLFVGWVNERKRAEKAEAERDAALAKAAEAEGTARTNAAWVQQQYEAAKEAREQRDEAIAESERLRTIIGKVNDYADTTVRGRSLWAALDLRIITAGARVEFAALDAVEPADQPHPTPEVYTASPGWTKATGLTGGDARVEVVLGPRPRSEGEAGEPTDQPHPTPEADECLHTPEHSRTLCGYCGEQESWCLDCGAALHKCEAGS